MMQFNKALVSLIMSACAIASYLLGWEIPGWLSETQLTVLLTALTPALVYLVPNLKKKFDATGKILAFAILVGASMLIASSAQAGQTLCLKHGVWGTCHSAGSDDNSPPERSQPDPSGGGGGEHQCPDHSHGHGHGHGQGHGKGGKKH